MRKVRSFAARATALATASAMLAGCSTQPAGPITEAQLRDIHQSVNEVLTSMNQAANKNWLSGAVMLEVSIARDNSLLGCTATSTSGAPGLVAVAERACWASVFPPMPAEVFDADGKGLIRMPMIFGMDPPADPQLRASYEGILFPAFSQGQYFWDNGIRAVPTHSVGQVVFHYVADHQGRVLVCNAIIDAVESRPAQFRDNPLLIKRLSAACQAMNLSKMPGFAVAANGLATGSVWMFYAPWRQAAPKATDY
jgi:hypothetical protein